MGKHRRLQIPGKLERDQGQAGRRQHAADDHQTLLRDRCDQDRHGHRIQNPADPKAGDDGSRDRSARLARGDQQDRHIGKQAVNEHRFEKHGAEAYLGARIREHALESFADSGQMERRGLGKGDTAERKVGRDGYGQPK